MNGKEEFTLASTIVSSIIQNSNIEVHFAKDFEEVGLKDKQSGGYILIGELVDYLTRYLDS